MRAIGQDPNQWVVRVLDINPPMRNAYVLGGRYVYIYMGLMDYMTNDDELAFVLAHEMGHSLLQHQYRKSRDASTAVADIAVIVGALWKRNRQALDTAAVGVRSAYSRLDEEEADAMGAVIAAKAGFDPLQGAGLFSRMRQDDDTSIEGERQTLAQSLVQVQQVGAACANDKQLYQYSQYRTSANYQIVVTACQSCQVLAAQYNQAAQSFNALAQQRSIATIFSDHPSYDDRVGAIAAATDYFAGRRSLESLAAHQQTHRVMAALQSLRSH